MKRLFASALPLLFPFFLSLFPLAGLFIEQVQRQGFEQEQKTVLWEETAANLVEEIKVAYTFEAQIEQMAADFHQRFERLTDPSFPLTGERFFKVFDHVFPSSHRPQGTQIFGFTLVQENKLLTLDHPGLTMKNGRMLADFFTRGKFVEKKSDAEQANLKNRCHGFFGEHMDLEQFFGRFRGRLIPGEFLGNPAHILWNIIPSGKKGILGAYLVIFPYHAVQTSKPLHWALTGAMRRQRSMIPVLVPLQGEETLHKPVLPSEVRKTKKFWKTLLAAAGEGKREELVPFGRRSALPDGLWVFREILNPSTPYELWIVSDVQPSSAYRPSPAMILYAVLLCSFWIFVGAKMMVSGEPPPITMRVWVMSFLAFLAFISLSSLYFFGSYYIETAAERKKQDQMQALTAKMEEIDTGIAQVYRFFTDEACKLFFHPVWRRNISSPREEERRRTAKWTMERMRRLRTKIEIHNILTYDFYPEPKRKAYSMSYVNPQMAKAALEFFAPFVEGAAGKMDDQLPAQPQIASGSKGTNAITDILRFSLDPSAFTHFRYLRQQADVLESGMERTMICYDFISSGKRLNTAVLLQATVGGSFQNYLQLRGLESRFDENSEFSFGKVANGGSEPLFPSPSGSFWHGKSGKRLDELMNLSVKTNTARRFQTPGQAWYAHPCVAAKGFVLGGIVSFAPILETARQQRMNLRLFMLTLLILSTLLGISASNYLLIPLSRVELGLRQVAAGDLTVRVGLHRNDELGDLTQAFDQMIRGIQERRELGLFVSGHLESTISQMSEKPLEAEQKVGTILVSDMRNFTTLSEKYPARDIVSMLNQHHQAMAEVIQAEGGFVELFIGDAIVAAFYEKNEGESARQALKSAVKMMARHEELQAHRKTRGKFSYDIGIGLDRGSLLTGTIGSGGRLEHTILGLPRNRAEQLEALSKKGSHSRIMASGAVTTCCPICSFVSPGEPDVFEYVEGVSLG